MMRRRLTLAALTLVVAAILPLQAQDYEKPFRAGLEARDKNWKEVERQMREAIQLNPRESRDKVRTGFGSITRVGGTEYVPYFFLGEALFRQDDCAGAMDAWSHSEQQNVVQKSDRYKQLLAGLESCEKKGLLRSPKFEEAVAAAVKELSTATAATEAARARGTSAGEAYTSERQGQLDAAAGLIREAYAHFESGRRTRAGSEFGQVTIATRQAGGIIAAFEKELAGALLTRQSRLATIERDIAVATDTDRAIDQRKAWLTDSLVAVRQAARDALGRARRIADAVRAGTAAAPLAEGETLAASAKDKLQQVLNDALEIERKDRAARTEKGLRAIRQRFTSIDKGFKDFDSAARPTTDAKLTEERKALEKRYHAAASALETAGRSGDAAGIEAAGRTTEQIGARLARLLQLLGVKPVVPDALARGVTLFLDGNPAGALEALAPEGGIAVDERLLAHVYMFRAAARYALYLKSKPSDPAQLAEARAALVALGGLNSSLEPDGRVFSPRFIEFVQSTRRELASSSPSAASSQP